jgi:UV DNA damage endonuclease
MKIGYPCVNWSIGCTSNKKFRIKSFSEEKFRSTVKNNLKCLDKIVDYNIEHDLLFLRISSETIPFASHEICNIDWQTDFKNDLEQIGKKLNQNNFRVSMHPGQFTVINSPKESVVRNSISELQYHSDFLNLLQVDNTAKIQIHVGGVYGNKEEAIERFIKVCSSIPKEIKERLAI